jgi:hypothetical protein
MTELTIPGRFRGPARSGNGGWTCGSLAEQVPSTAELPTVQVTLRSPPPLETALPVRQLAADHPDNPRGQAVTVLLGGDTLVAEALEVDDELATVEQVDEPTAAEVMGHYPGLRNHPFPGCFVCGPDREPGDGLRIFPGPVPGRGGTVASLWTPAASLAVSGDLVDTGVERVDTATAWAALDCVGGWSEDLEGRPMVLGRMTCRVDALPVVGEEHVVVGQLRGSEGRKSFTASTLYDSDHRVVATAEHVWLAIDPAAFN